MTDVSPTTFVLLTAGLVASLLYGWNACAIFSEPPDGKPWAWKVHQFWFNFLGSAAGWIACSILVSKWRADSGHIDWLLAVVAFIGMTGHMPKAVSSVPRSS